LANQICEDTSYLHVKRRFEKLAEDSEACEPEVDAFVARYGSLRPVRVDEILILERLPISVGIEYDPDTEEAKEVVLVAYPHRRPAKAEHVASRYQKTLSDAGVPYGESRKGLMGFEFYDSHLGHHYNEEYDI